MMCRQYTNTSAGMLHPTIIFVIHLFFAVYMTIFPIVSTNCHDLLIHACVLASIIVHWMTNSDTCALTELEYWSRRLTCCDGTRPEIQRNQTFFGSIISPVYNITNKDVYSVTCLLLLFTIHKASLCYCVHS